MPAAYETTRLLKYRLPPAVLIAIAVVLIGPSQAVGKGKLVDA